MDMQSFDAVARRTADSISRRRSLLTLGGATLGVTLARPATSEAKKQGKKCKKKERKRCNKDATECRVTVQALCQPPGSPECLALQTCCDTCSADGFIACLIANTP